MGAGQNPTTVAELLEFIEFKLFDNSSGTINKNDSVQSNDDLFKIFIALIEVLDNGLSGITTLNSLTDSSQSLSVASTGTDFTITSSAGVHTFSIPTANGSNRGLLSASNWTLFNNKEDVLTFNNGLTRSGNIISIDYTKTTNTYSGAGLISSPLFKYTGSWFSGGSDETTKPFVLYEPSGVSASTGWSVYGTTIGINSASGFQGHFAKFKLNNTDKLTIDYTGGITSAGIIETASVFRFSTIGNIVAASDGIFTLFNAAQNNFTRLNFGGTTNLFVGLQRSGIKLQVVLSNGSAYAPLEVAEDPYSGSWDYSNEVPTKNAIYDKIQSLGISDGIYTPSFVNVANTSLYTARVTNYYRVGNKIHVEGWVTFSITTSGVLTQGTISLPIPATMASVYDAAGYINSNDGSGLFGTIAANAASSYLLVSFDIGNPLVNGLRAFTFGFTYKV